MDSISVKPLLDSVEVEGLAGVCASQLGLVAKASATTAGRKTNNLMGFLLFIIYGRRSYSDFFPRLNASPSGPLSMPQGHDPPVRRALGRNQEVAQEDQEVHQQMMVQTRKWLIVKRVPVMEETWERKNFMQYL